MTDKEIPAKVFGAIFSDVDVRDYKMICTVKKSGFPEEFELQTVRIKNQMDVGSCVAHSLSSIIEYYNNKQNGDPTEMSVGYIYGNRSTSEHKGAGMIMRDALEVVRKFGDVYKEDFSERFNIDNIEVPVATVLYGLQQNALYEKGYPHRISQYYRVDSESSMKAALMAGNPVLIAIEWFEDMDVVDGVLTTNYVNSAGGHCMFIYGWDKTGWKVQNSWGEDWGNNGTMIVPYDMYLEECWVLNDDIIEGTYIRKPFQSNSGRFIAKIINKICNNFTKTYNR